MKYGLQYGHDWKIVADNFRLKIEGDSVGPATLGLSLREMQTQEFWDNPTVQGSMLSELPEYRLSKFQQALPDLFAIELVKGHLINCPEAIAHLNKIAQLKSIK